MKNENGFTLIELLAVIIILGVLMIIAIPAVTKYIEESRKNSYISTAKSIVNGARTLVHSGSLDLNDIDTTYYIDGECIKIDNGYKSPYGDITKSYVIVTATNEGHEYYWLSVDSTGTGIKKIISIDNLDIENIETDINVSDLTTDKGIDGRENIVIVDSNCQKGETTPVGTRVRSTTGEKIVVCKKATTLHTKICERTEEGCGVKIGNGNTITYGTIPNGEIKAGDAFDCDINDDGVYDSETERFYYLRSDQNNSVLVYYQNTNGNVPYDLSGENWHGPRDAYKKLPGRNEWKNPFLIEPGTRQMYAQNNQTYTAGGDLEQFTYTEKVARLVSIQDINIACGITAGNYNTGELDRCNYFLENTDNYEFETANLSGFWLENPTFISPGSVWHSHGNKRNVASDIAKAKSRYGVRPVITIKTAYIE